MKDDLDQLIKNKVRDLSINATEFPGLFDAIYDLIIDKLFDIND